MEFVDVGDVFEVRGMGFVVVFVKDTRVVGGIEDVGFFLGVGVEMIFCGLILVGLVFWWFWLSMVVFVFFEDDFVFMLERVVDVIWNSVEIVIEGENSEGKFGFFDFLKKGVFVNVF